MDLLIVLHLVGWDAKLHGFLGGLNDNGIAFSYLGCSGFNHLHQDLGGGLVLIGLLLSLLDFLSQHLQLRHRSLLFLLLDDCLLLVLLDLGFGPSTLIPDLAQIMGLALRHYRE